jgi:hypothetical protein
VLDFPDFKPIFPKISADSPITLSAQAAVCLVYINFFKISIFKSLFDSSSGNLGFVVHRVAVGQVFSQYFGFTCQFSLHQLLHIHLTILSSTIPAETKFSHKICMA